MLSYCGTVNTLRRIRSMKLIPGSRRRHHVVRVGTFLIAVTLLTGMAGCGDGGGGVEYDLTITSTSGGSVTEPGEGPFTYDEGTVVDLVAEAEEGYYFVRWTGDVSTVDDVDSSGTTIAVNDDYSTTANFVPDGAELVWDWYDLDAIRDNLGGAYVLMNALDSTTAGYTELASEIANNTTGWQPIGTLEEPFVGLLEGQEYEIRDLFIDYSEESEESIVGLFGHVGEAGVIRNVGVVNTDVTGYQYVGGLVFVSLGTVSNCYVTGSVTSGDYVGGLVGVNLGNVSNSYSIGSVIGDRQVGGLAGWNGLNSTVNDCYSACTVSGNYAVAGLAGLNDGTVSNSYSTGNVIGDLHVGGLVGYSEVGTVSDSYSTCTVAGGQYVGGLVGTDERGAVINSYSTGSVTGADYVGGLVGSNWYGNATVSNSYSTGNVFGEGHVGGLVGVSEGTVSSCYSTGNVTGRSHVGGLLGACLGTVSNSYSTGSVAGNNGVGGLVGRNWHTVSDSYSTGSVTGGDYVGGLVGRNLDAVSNSYSTGSVSGSSYAGGLVGYGEGANNVTNCFWDTETSGQATSDGGTGKTTTYMKDIATFSGATWDIIAVADPGTRNPSYIWNIVDAVTYPFLSWQS